MMKICPECQTEYTDDVEFCANDGMKLRPVRAASDDPMIGKVLDGRWIVEDKIGEGGMGSVYKGSQKSVNRAIAIKTLRAALTDNDEFVDRFFREAKIATTINHPHCVTVLDFGQTEDDVLYLAMEYLDGMPLSDKLKEGGLTVKSIIKMTIQIASALAASHKHNIIHRDLKPDNVFLLNMTTGDIFAKVLDFGIAKVSDGTTQYTRTGQIFGTPEYMSPEQCSGQDLDGRSDLYSLGCILYEVLTGRAPFAGNNPMSILMAHVGEMPKSPSELGFQLPHGLERITMKLIEKERNDRYKDADALILALKEELSTLEGQAAIQRSQGFSSPVHATTPSGGLPMLDTAEHAAVPTPTSIPEVQSHFDEPSDEDWGAPTPPRTKKPLIIAGSMILLSIIAALLVVPLIIKKDTPAKPKTPKVAITRPTISDNSKATKATEKPEDKTTPKVENTNKPPVDTTKQATAPPETDKKDTPETDKTDPPKDKPEDKVADSTDTTKKTKKTRTKKTKKTRVAKKTDTKTDDKTEPTKKTKKTKTIDKKAKGIIGDLNL